jgi:AcrR family transcriptional regulator
MPSTVPEHQDPVEEPQRPTIPRGRHAPPLEVRITLQRERLFEAAASVFATVGYADASAEAISRAAGMSKATFYEHFANKEECIIALFEQAETVLIETMAQAAIAAGSDPVARLRASVRAFLTALARHPNEAHTLLVGIIGAGPAAAQRRDEVLARYAEVIDAENASAAADGTFPRFASRHDAFALVGACVELASRHVRLGEPKHALDLQPAIERVALGLLSQA